MAVLINPIHAQHGKPVTSLASEVYFLPITVDYCSLCAGERLPEMANSF